MKTYKWRRAILRVAFTSLIVIAGSLMYASPGWADDCSGSADCSRVVQGSGILAILLATVLGAGAAAAKPKRKVKKKKEIREVENCREAQHWIHNHESEADLAEAKVAPQEQRPVKYTERDGKVVASKNVKLQIDQKESYTQVTEPHWPNMTDAEKQAVKEYVDAMQAHEDGAHHGVRRCLPSGEQDRGSRRR